MHDFIHHPDDRIIVDGLAMSMDFWMLIEPGYALPAGYIGRLFNNGEVHQLILEGNHTHHAADLNDNEIAGYLARKAEYDAAYGAYQAGAYVENNGGSIDIYGPPDLSADKSEIANDGVDTITITCDLGDAAATDEIRWSVIAPDGSVIEEVDNAVAGVDTWQITTSHVGTHTVRVETDYFGWAEKVFEGV